MHDILLFLPCSTMYYLYCLDVFITLFFVKQFDTLNVMQCSYSLGFRSVVWSAVVAITLYLSQLDLAYIYVRYIIYVTKNMLIV